MKFKLKKYNMGGYLRYDDGGIFNEYNQSPEVQSIMRKQAAANAGGDTAAQAAQAIPVYGQLIAGGIKAGQAVGKATKDPYGIYKSKSSEVIDNMFDPVKNVSDFTNMKNPNDLVNHLSLGLIGTNSQQEELKKQKRLAQMRDTANKYEMNEEIGARNRAAIGGYQAAPYGKLGIKITGVGPRKPSRFSCGCKH